MSRTHSSVQPRLGSLTECAYVVMKRPKRAMTAARHSSSNTRVAGGHDLHLGLFGDDVRKRPIGEENLGGISQEETAYSEDSPQSRGMSSA